MITLKQSNPITQEQYRKFSDLLLERCGLRFAENRRVELEHGLRQAFAASTCFDLDEFYQLLKSPTEGAVEMDLLINAVTISETHFFRDAAQFNALFEQVFPRIIERKRAIRTLRIWSAGCATGEEPYSLAILLRELLPDADQWAITILATDINTFSLDRARKGLYSEWAFREERARRLRPRYFSKTENRYQLSDEIRRMVTFSRLNLVEPVYPAFDTNTTMMDLVICRNVTIYFGETVTKWVVDRFYDSLTDGGWLVVGHSEPTLETYQRFQVRNFPDTVLYQRVSRPDTPVASPWPPMPVQPPLLLPAKAPSQPIISPAPPIDNDAAPRLISSSYVPTQKLPDLLEQARSLLEFGRSEEACRLLLDLARARPRDAAITFLLAQAYANLGTWTESEAWAHRAIELDKLALDAYYILSLVLQHQGRLADSIEAMKKVVYLDRNYILGHFGLANLYHESGLMPQAQKSLENALRLLQARPEQEVVAGSQGIVVSRLREAIIHQQQAWSKLV